MICMTEERKTRNKETMSTWAGTDEDACGQEIR